MSWKVVNDLPTGVYIVPWDDEAGTPALDHTEDATCFCLPKRVTFEDGKPLDVGVWTHNEPGWPGSEDSFS